MQLIFRMKGFAMVLLGVIFVALITNTVSSIAVDDSGGNNVVSEHVDKLNIVPTKDSKYEVYMYVVIRNAHGELVSVTESFDDWKHYMHHEITDEVFDTLLGKKEIVTIDNIKYEKVQFSTSSEQPWLFDSSDRTLIFNSAIELCGEPIKKYGYECANIFWARNGMINIEVGDVITQQWTILRELN